MFNQFSSEYKINQLVFCVYCVYQTRELICRTYKYHQQCYNYYINIILIYLQNLLVQVLGGQKAIHMISNRIQVEKPGIGVLSYLILGKINNKEAEEGESEIVRSISRFRSKFSKLVKIEIEIQNIIYNRVYNKCLQQQCRHKLRYESTILFMIIVILVHPDTKQRIYMVIQRKCNSFSSLKEVIQKKLYSEKLYKPLYYTFHRLQSHTVMEKEEQYDFSTSLTDEQAWEKINLIPKPILYFYEPGSTSLEDAESDP